MRGRERVCVSKKEGRKGKLIDTRTCCSSKFDWRLAKSGSSRLLLLAMVTGKGSGWGSWRKKNKNKNTESNVSRKKVSVQREEKMMFFDQCFYCIPLGMDGMVGLCVCLLSFHSRHTHTLWLLINLSCRGPAHSTPLHLKPLGLPCKAS